MVAPLSTLLAILAAFAPPAHACAYGPAGHVHVFASPPADGSVPAVEIGRCGGQGAAPVAAPPPDPNSAPLSLKKSRLDEPSLKNMSLAGFRADTATDRLYSPPDGKVVTLREFERLLSPVDASKEAVFYENWMGLQLQGYRLDEKTCALVHPEHGALRHLDISVQNAYSAKGRSHAALEALLADLNGLPPDKPVPPGIIEKLRNMEKTGLKLQDNIRAQIFAANPPTVKSLGASAQSAYQTSTLFFDGARDLGSFIAAVKPLGTAGAVPARPRIPVADEETRLGRLFATEFKDAFARVAPGRELLERFRGRDGAIQLPTILCLKLSQKPGEADIGALYEPSTKQVVINHWEIAKWTVALAPKGDQARLAASFSDPAALRRYLEANPAVRHKVVDLLDSSVFHELIHYKQGDDSKVSIESMRGNLPSGSPLSFEREAHRRTCLYALSRQTQDPSLALSNYGSTGASDCQKLMADADVFDAHVNDTYRRNYSWFGDLPDIAKRQQVRRTTSTDLALGLWTQLGDRFEQGLKLLGMPHGDDALAAENARIRLERRDFDGRLKSVRAEWLKTVPQALLISGHPDAALVAFESAGLENDNHLARGTAIAAANLLRRGEPKASYLTRIMTFQAYQRLSNRLGLGVDRPLYKAYAADVRLMLDGLKVTPVPGLDVPAWTKALADMEKNIRDSEAQPQAPAGATR